MLAVFSISEPRPITWITVPDSLADVTAFWNWPEDAAVAASFCITISPSESMTTVFWDASTVSSSSMALARPAPALV